MQRSSETAARVRGRALAAGRLLLAIVLAWGGVHEVVRGSSGPGGSYLVVVSAKTQADKSWKQVVDALVKRHAGAVIAYDRDVREVLERLQKVFPRYTCFVATPSEATREFVAAVHALTRKLDADPYTDTIWGILTGHDPANALEIARTDKPLTVNKVLSGTEVALRLCEEGVWYSELQEHRRVRKLRGKEPVVEEGPSDTTQAIVECLNKYQPDLFVTSGHATERDWQIGYRYRNGRFVSADGRLTGVDTHGNRFPVNSPNPKVYLPIGNCLMGHIDGPDAMAIAFMKSAGVRQMIGYTVPTWYGYAGWGCLDYFLEQPGRYTFAEAFFANQQALLHRLETGSEKDADRRGLLYDRDTLALYGDPAWEARMAREDTGWDQSLKEKDGVYTFEITPRRGSKSFDPVNTNGSQRGGRPFFALLPRRLKDIEIVEGADLHPLITDNFILVPHPGKCDPESAYRVVFRARKV